MTDTDELERAVERVSRLCDGWTPEAAGKASAITLFRVSDVLLILSANREMRGLLQKTTDLLASANRSTDRPSDYVSRVVMEARSALTTQRGGWRMRAHSASLHTQPATDGLVVGWQPMESAPKDRPILGWCVHDADPYFIEPEDGSGRSRLTLYGGHTEGLSHTSDGPHVIEWGGAWDDGSHEYDGGWMPDWWFRSDSEFEVTANPILWMDIPAPTTPAADTQVGIPASCRDEPKNIPANGDSQ